MVVTRHSGSRLLRSSLVLFIVLLNGIVMVNARSTDRMNLMHMSKRVPTCPAKTYRYLKTCRPCSADALTCTSSGATSCATKYLYKGVCKSVCPQTFYADTSTHTCLKCNANVLTCTAAHALTCSTTTYLSHGACVHICPVGTFASLGVCAPCTGPCGTTSIDTFVSSSTPTTASSQLSSAISSAKSTTPISTATLRATASTVSTTTSTASAAAISTTSATKGTMYLPVDKIRGVNLGSLFIVEPWMAGTQWANMGCGAYPTEASCFQGLGAQIATAAFVSHWSSWYTAHDFIEMASYGLNAVRVPVGYWMVDAIIGTDPFPPGGFKYLKQVCKWAKEAGLYVLIDLHAAPGAQTDQSFAGQEGAVNFFQESNYERAWKFFTNITTEVHSDADFSTVFALQAVNEPQVDQAQLAGLVGTYYPGVEKAVRDAETALGISCSDSNLRCLGIMYMNIRWDEGTDPKTNLNSSDKHLLYDDHPYFKWSGIQNTRTAHMAHACALNPSSIDTPLVAGEWSIDPVDETGEMAANSTGAAAFYTKLASAAMKSFENTVAGWMFWSWKTDLNTPFWDYQYAVQNGFIPETLTNLDDSGCN